MILVMSLFEKPRTTVGWKGLIMDPKLNGSCDIPEGLRIARSFLGEVLDLGILTATEFLDPITQYVADSLCWAAIGARTSNLKLTDKWHQDFPCQWDLKMRPAGI